MYLTTYSIIFVLAFCQIQGVLIKNGSLKVLGGIVDNNSPNNTAGIFSKDMEHVCSGALIHSTWVLTSAFCAKLSLKYDMRVVIGGSFSNKTFDNAITIKNQYINPNFDSLNKLNDIALLQLKVPADNAEVFKIPAVDEDLDGKKCILKGYGYYEPSSDKPFPGNLTQRYVHIIENNICGEYPIIMTNKKMCSAQAVACRGDEGAPLISLETNELEGIVSIHENFEVCGFQAIPLTIYTRIVPYKDWIKSITNINL